LFFGPRISFWLSSFGGAWRICYSPPVIGTLLQDRYELLGELGRGGMALVYRARDRRLGREVAIKLISTDGLDEGAIERFQREALLIAGLDHSAIVPIYDYGRHVSRPGTGSDGWLFFVMPILPGRTLHTLFRDAVLSFDDFLEIFIRVAEALDYSASQRIVHRDIKPENIMVSLREGSSAIDRVWVMDFGLATAQETTRLTRTGNLPGTLAYLSPEQVLSLEVDGRTDLYSLGVIAYEFLAGRPPHVGSPATLLYRIVNQPIAPLDRGKADPRFLALVERCLAKDAGQRFATGRELAAAARDLLHPGAWLPAPVFGKARADRDSDDGAQVGVAEPLLFGRAAELAEIDQRLAAALRGEGQMVLIGGDPGSGKSRLLREVARRARKHGMVALQGRFADTQGGYPFQAICEILLEACARHLFPPAFEWRLVAGGLVDLFPALAEVPEIAAAIEPREAKSGDLAHLYELIGRTLGGLAGGRPLLLLFEEMHAADASLPLLLYLFRRFGPSPTLLVGAYRRTEVNRRHPLSRLIRGLEGDERFRHLELGNLSENEHRQLLGALLGNDPGPAVASRIFEATDGNPLFASEVVRSLGRSGELRRDHAGQLLLRGDEGLGEIPATLQQALEVRLERLSEAAGDLLELASVLGRTFALRDLEALAAEEGMKEVDDTLDRLLADGLLEEEKGSESRGKGQGGIQLRFSSGLLCQLVGERLSRRRRRRLHQRAALALERRYGDNLERVFPRLLHHWAAAESPARAVPYGLLHVRQLLAGACWEDVLRTARLTLDFLEEDAAGTGEIFVGSRAPVLLEEIDLRGAEGELRLAVATALRATGQVDGALREAEKALRADDRAALAEEAAQAAFFLAETCFANRRIEPCQTYLDAGLVRARVAVRAAGQAGRALRELLELQATTANLRGDYAKASESLAELESLAAVGAPRPAAPVAGGELRVGLVNDFHGAEPALAFSMSDAEVLGNVFEPLLAVDREGRLSPLLCSSFEASPDGRLFVFDFAPGRTFADGRPVDAANVKLALETAARRGGSRLQAILGAVAGAPAVLAGEASEIPGLKVRRPLVLEIELEQEMAFFPSLLTDLRAAIALPAQPLGAAGEEDGRRLVGSGPFLLESWSRHQAVLRRNPLASPSPLLDRVSFRVLPDSPQAIAAFAEGKLDLALELRPNDLEELARDPRLRAAAEEVDQHAVCYLLLAPRGPRCHDPRLRRILAGVIDVRHLLWRTVARYVAPAFGLLPPEVLGHDAGREPRQMTRIEAIEALEELRPLPIKLKALTYHRFADQYRPLVQAMLAEWSLFGLEVELEEVSPEKFLAAMNHPAEIDLVFVRWAPDHLDADAFVYDAFHSEAGSFGRLAGDAELDELAEKARRERHLAARDLLYRRFDERLVRQDVILPLCRELTLRLVSPAVGGLGRNFACGSLGLGGAWIDRGMKRPEAPPRPKGSLAVPLLGSFNYPDPAASYLVDSNEVVPNIFETLTTIGASGAPVPHLAEEFWAIDGGRRFRFRLRDVRFHDGRKLTTRDVHYSLARMLRSASVEFALLDLPIVGATALRQRESSELAGFHSLSDREFELELEEPLPFFPALLSFPLTAVVPENCHRFDLSWRDGCAGTGPFRLIACEAGRRIEMAANPNYWRPGAPRVEKLVFHLGSDPANLADDLKSGAFHLASGLSPGELAAFARESQFAGGLVRQPTLTTHFAVLDPRRGPLAELETRRRVTAVLRKARAELAQLLGPAGVVAETLLPPSLLGVDVVRREESAARLRGRPLAGIELVVALHSRLLGPHAGLWSVLTRALTRAGATVKVAFAGTGELLQAFATGEADMALVVWSAPYPDADAFATMFEPATGLLRRAVADPRIPALRARARTEADPAERRRLYLELEERLASGAHIVPLFHEQACWLARPGVKGLRLRFGWPRVAWEEISLD
jgi:ABC-type transport system substrate-binding protein